MEKEIDGFVYEYEKGKLIRVLRPKKSDNKNLKVPGIIDGQNISEIESRCFSKLTLKILDLSEMLEVKVLPNLFCANCHIEEFKLPKNLTEISNSAIVDSTVKKMQIPNFVEKIGDWAFFGLKAKITFPENTKISFGEYACAGNLIPKLTVWPGWKMKNSCFYGNCISVLKIKEGVKEIPEDCFSFNYLMDITLPNSIEKIKTRAFMCNQISVINVNWENLLSLDCSAFSFNKLTGILDLSELLVEEIPMYCFAKNGIKEVIVNDYVTKIDPSAFEENEKIKITISAFTKIVD